MLQNGTGMVRPRQWFGKANGALTSGAGRTLAAFRPVAEGGVGLSKATIVDDPPRSSALRADGRCRSVPVSRKANLMSVALAPADPPAVPIQAVTAAGRETLAERLPPGVRAFALSGGFDPFAAGRPAGVIPPGRYRLHCGWPEPALAALGFAPASDRFARDPA